MGVEHCEGTMSCQDIYPNGTKKQKPNNLKSVGIVLTKKQTEELAGLLQSIAANSADDSIIDLTGYWRGPSLKVTRRKPSRHSRKGSGIQRAADFGRLKLRH